MCLGLEEVLSCPYCGHKEYEQKKTDKPVEFADVIFD
jgi:predicted nucleic-acid-binding Zn-ribbon protein